MSRKHFVLPDTQAKPGVPLNHMIWAGSYCANRKPDVIVHVGDHWDMPSLSHWDKGKMAAEGRAYEDDIQAGNLAMDLFMGPIYKEQARLIRLHGPRSPLLWTPRKVFTIGNHEQRIERHVNGNPELRRTLGYHSFNLERHGWEVHDFLHPVTIDGLTYQHYIPNPNTGRPWGGMAEPRLSKIGYSFVSGHEQGKKSGERYLQNGRTQRALIVGSYYMHDEDYKGPQGNYHWRGVVMLHNVGRGDYDLMETRMDYLQKKYYTRYPHASRETIRYVPKAR